MSQAKQRSPNYPAFTLEEAIKKISVLYEKDGKAGALKEVALQHLGYTSATSGTALRILSTLKTFGLIKTQKGRIILTDEALDILLYPKNDRRYINTLTKLALKPRIYAELYEGYKERGGLPSDDQLKAELIKEHNFNRKMVDKFIQDFRNTINFANLQQIEESEREEQYSQEEETTMEQPVYATTVSRAKEKHIVGESYPIRFPDGNKATLVFERLPVKKEHIKLIKDFINLFESSFTSSTENTQIQKESNDEEEE